MPGQNGLLGSFCWGASASKKKVFGSLGSICVDVSDCTLPKCKKLRLGEHLVSLSFTSLNFGDKITRGFNVLGLQCVLLKLFI